jgi:hypothetical protein
MSVWFFCHWQMVTFARSPVLLRPVVAQQGAPPKNGHVCVHKGRELTVAGEPY